MKKYNISIILSKVTLFLVVMFFSLLTIKTLLKFIKDDFILQYFDYCLQSSEHFFLYIASDKEQYEEFNYIPYKSVIYKKVIPNKDKYEDLENNFFDNDFKFDINDIIVNNSEKVTNKYMKELTSYDMNDMFDLLDQTYIK